MFGFTVRRNALLVCTGLVVAYVRTYLQYKSYPHESIAGFLGSWFIHYVALALVVGVCYACIKASERFFLEQRNQSKGLTLEEALVYIPLTILVCAALIFVMAHWIPSEPYDYDH